MMEMSWPMRSRSRTSDAPTWSQPITRMFIGLPHSIELHTVKEKNGGGVRAPVRGAERCYARLMFSFACQKRTRKAPAISTRWIHEKGAARPFQTPKEMSKHKNASRFAKRIFCTSPVYGSADGVTFSQNFMFCKGVKSAAKQQMGETRKKR